MLLHAASIVVGALARSHSAAFSQCWDLANLRTGNLCRRFSRPTWLRLRSVWTSAIRLLPISRNQCLNRCIWRLYHRHWCWRWRRRTGYSACSAWWNIPPYHRYLCAWGIFRRQTLPRHSIGTKSTSIWRIHGLWLFSCPLCFGVCLRLAANWSSSFNRPRS